MLEKDLYKPLKRHFEAGGYEVKGEVLSCDIIAVKDEELVAVELKLRLNLDVILQAVERQEAANTVYIAVSATYFKRTKRAKSIIKMLKHLEIGLILIAPNSKNPVHIEHEAKPYDRVISARRGNKQRGKIIDEFYSRHGDNNEGGSTKQKLVTAYREKAIVIANLLSRYGSMKPSTLRELGADVKATTTILRNNHYGWFENLEKGVYALTEEGQAALESYRTLSAELLKEIGIDFE